VARDFRHRLEIPAADPPAIDELPGLVHAVSDREGRLVYISQGIENLLGFSAEFVLAELACGRDPLPPIDRDRDLVTRTWAESGASGTPFTCEYRVRHRDGRIVWVRSHGRWRQTTSGERLLDAIVLDVTEAKEAQSRLTLRLQLNEIFRPLDDARDIMSASVEALGRQLELSRCSFAELDASGKSARIDRDYCDGVASLANHTYRLSDFGGAAAAELRQNRTVAIDDVEASEMGAPAAAYAAVGVRSLLAAPLVRRGRLVAILALQDKQPRTWTRNEIAIAEEVGLQTWRAVEQARAEAALRQSEEQLQLAVETGEIAIWDWDLRSGRITLGGNALRTFGLEPGAFGETLEAFAALVHPDDIALVSQASREASGDDAVEFRIVRPNGEVRWISARGRTYRDARGQAVRMIGVGQDVTAHKELMLLAERTREQAEEANKAKDEILRMVSHELRTPITPLVGWIRELREDFEEADSEATGIGDARHVLGIVERNALNLSRLVSDLVDASRIETGKLHVELGPIDLGPVVHAALRSLSPVAQANGVTLEVSLDPHVGTIQGDAGRLEQVAANLISNAVKFTPRGGKVSVRLEGGDDGALLRVSDTGAGISASFLSRVFERFAQEDRPDLTVRGGLGLGLAIVRHVVELHGGTISAESAGPGLGSTFTVRLPRSVGSRRP
jgi:PAS domain S-box-containing protein